MTPLYPAARVDLLPEAATQTKIVPRLVILHTNAGGSSTNGFQLRAWMARTDVTLECHFQVDLDGRVHQFMPVTVRADCNAAANPFAVSIETQDQGGATVNVTAWTPAQCTAIALLLRWLHDTAGIPLVRATAWNGAGVGAHRDFPQWSGDAHSCPGVARCAQVPGLILAASNPKPTPPEEDGMPHFVVDETGDIWLDEIDWQGKEWADTVGNLGIDWRLWDLSGLPPRKRAYLEAKRTERSRPTPATAPSSGVTEHVHAIVGAPIATGGVVP